MAFNSTIEWTDHTFNPWIGCTKVDELCAHCYAETRDKRHLIEKIDHWGKGAPRMRTSPGTWKQPIKWNRAADDQYHAAVEDCKSSGRPFAWHRPRVFCASLADWLDDDGVPIEWLTDLLKLIRATPNLDWLLLTKRPENWRTRICDALVVANGGDPTDKDWFTKYGDDFPKNDFANWLNDWTGGTYPDNVLIGTSVGTQKSADKRIPALLKIPARVRFLSCEPLLGPLEFSNVTNRSDAVQQLGKTALDGIHWVICGGESGPGARPMHPAWARSLRDQCANARVSFFFKQWGEYIPPFIATAEIYRRGGHWIYVNKLNGKVAEDNYPERDPENWETMCRVGKKSAGRLLDGREWNEFPSR